MNSILKIWNEVEKFNTSGLLKRLYNSQSLLHIYAIFQNPERNYGIALSYNKNIRIDISSFSNLRELQVSLQHDASFSENNLLIIKLLHYQNKDVFAVMCENMVKAVLNLTTEQQIVKAIINQLEKWKILFEKLRGEGLTVPEQQGLYGELHFLKKFLEKQDTIYALNSWVGADRELRDFQYDSWALEVKTTAGNNHQKVNISSERQLDETLLENLFLFHLSVETAKKNGESLNAKVNAIREFLQSNLLALNVFNNKLLNAGYFENHKHLYEERCYQIRYENYYKIKDKFPRIKESEIRNGVGDVKYSIILAQCNDYSVSESVIFNIAGSK
ncbi:MAG: PD-(D/E)XK motif protein [Campylobacteraceae bacterium]|jgi:hypothetical protein|nr:PD-(D/E)XK motif protein [Campylobacteraceae bacterium]